MKLKPYSVPITEEQKSRLERATAVLSRRRGQSVALATAMREWALEVADRILEAEEAA